MGKNIGRIFKIGDQMASAFIIGDESGHRAYSIGVSDDGRIEGTDGKGLIYKIAHTTE
jgi:hypothetical protein